MTDIYADDPNQHDAPILMEDLFIKYFENRLTPGEREEFLKKVMADPELKRQLTEYKTARALAALCPQEGDREEGQIHYQQFIDSIHTEEHTAPKLMHGLRSWIYGLKRYAAVIIACMLATWWVTSMIDHSNAESMALQVLTVPAGQRAHLVLPDGSTVWVNAGSTISYPSTFGDERRIRLSGEAFFDVAKNEKKPFIVSAEGSDIHALGTEFNVFAYKNSPLVVSLMQGSVRVYKSDDETKGVTLAPGQQVTALASGYKVGQIAQDPVMWRSGIYAFENVPLSEIVSKIELYYDIKVIIDDPALLNQRYTGKFRQRDGAAEVFRLIQKTHPFEFSHDIVKNEIVVTKTR